MASADFLLNSFTVSLRFDSYNVSSRSIYDATSRYVDDVFGFSCLKVLFYMLI